MGEAQQVAIEDDGLGLGPQQRRSIKSAKRLPTSRFGNL